MCTPAAYRSSAKQRRVQACQGFRQGIQLRADYPFKRRVAMRKLLSEPQLQPLPGMLLVFTVYHQAAGIARQRIGTNQRQRAFGVAFTIRTQVMPLNLRDKRAAQRFYMTCRTRVNAVGQFTGKFHYQSHTHS